MLAILMNEYKDRNYRYADYTAQDMEVNGYSVRLINFIICKYRFRFPV